MAILTTGWVVKGGYMYFASSPQVSPSLFLTKIAKSLPPGHIIFFASSFSFQDLQRERVKEKMEQDLSQKCSAWKHFVPFSLKDRVKCGV